MVAASATNVSTTGQYAICQLPADRANLNCFLFAACTIVCGGAATTAGVGAWVIVLGNGTVQTLATPAFPAINALAGNSASLFVFPQATLLGGVPIHGVGMAITTAITGGPLAYVEVIGYYPQS
jgi:hypothetical protein